MRLAVITMVQRDEFPSAWASLATVTSQLGADRHRFVLLNDRTDAALLAQLRNLPHTTVLAPGTNLGVARGRNTLIGAGIEWGADTLVSLDDDLIVPCDFLDRMTERIQSLTAAGSRVGVVAPCVLDYADASVHDLETQASAVAGRPVPAISTGEIRSLIRQRFGKEVPVTVAYHMGIRHWRDHYLYPSGRTAETLRGMACDFFGIGYPQKETELRLSEARNVILEDAPEPILVDTLPGGVSAFSRELVDEVGLTEEAFSPFGYEDADFAIRAVKAGFQNFVLPSEIVLHDLQHRHRARNSVRVAASVGKGRALLMRHCDRRTRIFEWVVEAMLLGISQSRVPVQGSAGRRAPAAFRHALAYLAGLVVGVSAEFSTESAPQDEGSLWRDALSRSDIGGNVRITRTPTDDRIIRMATERLTLHPLRSLLTGGGRDSLSGRAAATIITSDSAIHVTSAILDFPGQIQVQASCSIDGIDPDITGSDRLLRKVRLRSASLRIRDQGFIRRLETTSAWRRNTPMRSQLQRLLSPPGSNPLTDAIHEFLSHDNAASTLEINAFPTAPLSIDMLSDLEQRDSWDAFIGAMNLTWSTSNVPDTRSWREPSLCHM